MAGQDVFKGALGWDDWVWWLILGGVALLVLLLLVCCCVCVQRAKRKGHEQALASVQRRQREAEQRHAQQQQFAQLQQAAAGPPPSSSQQQADAYGQPYAKPVQAVPLAPPPGRKQVMGPQVAANGYLQPQQGHQQAQQYPPYQQQQQQQMPPFQQQQQQPPPYQQQYAQPQAPYAAQQYGNYPPAAPAQSYAAPAAYRGPPQHQEQFQKPYPPLPQQQQQQQRPQPPPPAAVQFHEPEKAAEEPAKPLKRRYHPPPRWYNALAASEAAAAAAAAAASTTPASPSSASNHNAFEDDAERSVDSIRYDPYGTQGNLNSAPFVSVTSPTAGDRKKPGGKPQRPALGKPINTAATSGSASPQLPPPVVVATKYQSAPTVTPSVETRYAGPRPGSEVVSSYSTSGTLADRINALREGQGENMAHSRVSDLHDRDFPSPASVVSASAFASFKTNSSADRRAPADGGRRSAVLVGSLLSPGSSSTRSAGTSTSGSARREPGAVLDDSFDGELLSSGAMSSSTMSRRDQLSLGSNHSHGQFEDADDQSSRKQRPTGVRSRDSVEF